MPKLPGLRKKRILACTICRKRKIKCTQLDSTSKGPCVRCSQRKLPCEYRPVEDELQLGGPQALELVRRPCGVEAQWQSPDTTAIELDGRRGISIHVQNLQSIATSASWGFISVPASTSSQTVLSTAFDISRFDSAFEPFIPRQYACDLQRPESKSPDYDGPFEYDPRPGPRDLLIFGGRW
ncbi:hypothetical protein FB45DRAFT_934447 [Roridomyces roridus]|uniref:Zn(2)-C6 fungal-type domain-containing protein n=1 Tax=Roridomyces roridus TaxID=1738132 RepID=A0AAD7BCE1_9AGAR|nr:hypothetical protein FB45DRAFT_934447 [Roridomyces roridus]